MQPMVNIALRAIRSTTADVKMILTKEEFSFERPDSISRTIDRINATFYTKVAKALQRAYPKSHIADYGDLRGKAGNFSWHILPLHNPASLIHGLPDWCFSLVCKKNHHPEHSLVVFPQTDEEYTASKGAGAALNERRLRVTAKQELAVAVVSSNILQQLSNSPDPEKTLKFYQQLDRATNSIRSGHCLPQQLVWVAAGKLDATLLNNADPTETAAALLIAKEAGALTGDFNGGPLTERSHSIICSNAKLLRALSQQLRPQA